MSSPFSISGLSIKTANSFDLFMTHTKPQLPTRRDRRVPVSQSQLIVKAIGPVYSVYVVVQRDEAGRAGAKRARLKHSAASLPPEGPLEAHARVLCCTRRAVETRRERSANEPNSPKVYRRESGKTSSFTFLEYARARHRNFLFPCRTSTLSFLCPPPHFPAPFSPACSSPPGFFFARDCVHAGGPVR